jgi:amidase
MTKEAAAMTQDNRMAQLADAAHCFVPYPRAIPAAAGQGPLAGLRFAVKDIFDVAGYPSGCGNPHMLAMSGVKTVSAPVVTELLQAGAVFVAKTVTDELAFSLSGKNAHFGTPLNGAAPQRIPGGSSSGSASAVSNGLVDFALGTDTGGSVRGPASHCGLVGMRPTHARISLRGCMDLAPSFDTCGWFARDIDTFARIGEVLLDHDETELPDAPAVLVAQDVLAMLAPRVQAVFAATLKSAAVATGVVRPVTAATPSFEALYGAFRHIQGYQAWEQHGARIERYDMQLGPGVKERFAWSAAITAGQLAQHTVVRETFQRDFGKLLGGNSVLVLPSMPDIAPLLGDSEEQLDAYRAAALRMLCLAGLSGFPQISLPVMQLDGAPLGFSVIGPAGSDSSLIRFAAKLTRAVEKTVNPE